jgi:SAM-dependent methyltransferase
MGDEAEAFWNECYRSGRTPWDFGGVPADFQSFLVERGKLGRVLVPGCGLAYEVRELLRRGNEALGIDLSNEAVTRAKALLGETGQEAVCQADFFEAPLPEASFGAVYERTFLCALPPALAMKYPKRVRSLLRPGGLLIGYFLYGEEEEPPPYPMPPEEEHTAFQEDFDMLVSRPSSDPLPLFAGMEFWQVWRRR